MGPGRNFASICGSVLRALCGFVVERSAPEIQSLRRCVQLDLWPPSWRAHEAANFMASLFYDRISRVSKWCLTSVLASQLKTCA